MSEESNRVSQSSNLVKVGEAAKQLGVTPRTLKNWEGKNGVPLPKRNNRNERVYTPEDIELIRQVKGIGVIIDPNQESKSNNTPQEPGHPTLDNASESDASSAPKD